jgi:prolyl oligopeptidase
MTTRRTLLAGIGATAGTGLMGFKPAYAAMGPPVARVEPVVMTRFGITTTDPYRWMENPKDPEWLPYAKGQGAYARHVLDKLPGRAALEKRIAGLSGGTEAVRDLQRAGDNLFLTVRPVGASSTRLEVQGVDGTRRILFDPNATKAEGGAHISLDWWRASPDGTHVVYGSSPAGSEESVGRVIRVADGVTLNEVFGRALFGPAYWLPDSSGFFINRLSDQTVQGTPDYFMKSVCWLHKIGQDPKDDLKAATYGLHQIVDLTDGEIPIIVPADDSEFGILLGIDGVRRELSIWSAPLDGIVKGSPAWTKVCAQADKITGFAQSGSTLYLTSENENPLGRVVAVDLAEPSLAKAREVVPASQYPIEALSVASDGLYIQIMDGGPQRLRRLDKDGKLRDLAMPFEAGVYAMFSNVTRPGLDMVLSGWLQHRGIWNYNPDTDQFLDTGLSPKPNVDLTPFESKRYLAKAKDGTKIPYVVIAAKNATARGPAPCLADAYGAYQVSNTPFVNLRTLAMMELGGILMFASVRGGGDYGRPWYEAGKKTTKSNTWNDYIACCEDMIARGLTSPSKLTIKGTSAGGIAVGRAMTTRPDLFAGVICDVGSMNTSRTEVEQNGPGNFPEFGDPSVAEDYRNLVGMDTYLNVKDDIAYPAVMVITGATDPRVAPYHGAKLAARLQALPKQKKPVLMRVTFDEGHGIGSTREQIDSKSADEYAFTLWRAGAARFQPRT